MAVRRATGLDTSACDHIVAALKKKDGSYLEFQLRWRIATIAATEGYLIGADSVEEHGDFISGVLCTILGLAFLALLWFAVSSL